MKLNERELATVLHALRKLVDPMNCNYCCGHFDDVEPLDADEIDDLCERLNCGQQEPWGTLEGAERYLEHQDRMAFLDLRRAKQANYNELTIDLLQDRWIAYGDAWGEVKRLLEKPESIALH